MRKIKGVSYDTDRDADVIAYVGAMSNGSKYILDLVRADMRGEMSEGVVHGGVIVGSSSELRDMIRSCVAEYVRTFFGFYITLGGVSSSSQVSVGFGCDYIGDV